MFLSCFTFNKRIKKKKLFYCKLFVKHSILVLYIKNKRRTNSKSGQGIKVELSSVVFGPELLKFKMLWVSKIEVSLFHKSGVDQFWIPFMI